MSFFDTGEIEVEKDQQQDIQAMACDWGHVNNRLDILISLGTKIISSNVKGLESHKKTLPLKTSSASWLDIVMIPRDKKSHT